MKCKKKKRLAFKVKAAICLGVVFSLILAAFLHFYFIVGPKVVEISRSQVDSVATTMISDAIYNVMLDKNYNYDDFVDIKYSSNNEIT